MYPQCEIRGNNTSLFLLIPRKIVGGTLNDTGDAPKENFAADKPSTYYAETYKSDNLPGGHVIALGPGNEEAALAALSAYPGGLRKPSSVLTHRPLHGLCPLPQTPRLAEMGGGINPDNAMKYINAGASHVIVTSYVFKACPFFSAPCFHS